MFERPPFLVDDADVPALREAISLISRAGYCETAVRERLGLHDITDLHWRSLPIYRDERLTERDPLALAIDLFLLQGAIAVDEAERLLPITSREVLLRTKLFEIDEAGRIRARASLFLSNIFLAQDFRVSLSVSPFTEIVLKSGTSFSEGVATATTVEAVQRLFVSHGANEVYARIATSQSYRTGFGDRVSFERQVNLRGNALD